VHITQTKRYSILIKSHLISHQIYLRNPDILEEKLFRLKAAGVDELQIIVGKEGKLPE